MSKTRSITPEHFRAPGRSAHTLAIYSTPYQGGTEVNLETPSAF